MTGRSFCAAAALVLTSTAALVAALAPVPAFATARLASGAGAVRDMIVDAWRASVDTGVGYPEIKARDIENGKHVLARDDFGRD